jgi:AcrR family transcriptional regulator
LDRLKAKVLAQLRPESFVAPTANWQQRKSGEMRIRILDATVDCLVDKGYAGLSTSEVTKRAGISRGAMHHHFASRMALVAAVIEYAVYLRMERFLSDYFKALAARGEGSVVEVASESHWKSVQTREYAAYLELAVAARTDTELNSYFEPAARKLDKVWTKEMIKSFPQWEEHWDALQIANDFAMAAHMGLLLHTPIFGRGKRIAAVRDLVAAVIRQLHTSVDGR